MIVVDCAMQAAGASISATLNAGLQRNNTCMILDRFDELCRDGQKNLLMLLEHDRRPWSQSRGVIATSTADPDSMERDGCLRPDLLHRIKGGSIALEPLRSNPDLDGAIREFLKIELAGLARSGVDLDANARLVLLNYHWPGNLRELRTALRHAVALAEGISIGLQELPTYIVAQIAQRDLTARSQSETSRIKAALRYNNGNVSQTVKYLGVSRATLYRKIEIQKMRGDGDDQVAEA
jgi:transcriptional regulator of acetoin/glycerol metabolism